MSTIYLHPTKGVNPRLTICRNCGKDVGVALLGSREGLYTCTSCGTHSIGGRPGKDRPGHLGSSICPKCEASDSYVRERSIEDGEKLPIELCDECKKLEDDTAQMVREGGVYFKCAKCGSAGAIKGTHELAIEVRKKLEVEAPKPCGIEFDEKTCPVCTGALKVDAK